MDVSTDSNLKNATSETKILLCTCQPSNRRSSSLASIHSAATIKWINDWLVPDFFNSFGKTVFGNCHKNLTTTQAHINSFHIRWHFILQCTRINMHICMHNCFPALHWESGFLVFSFSVMSQDCGWLITVWRRLRRSWNLIHIKFRATALECWLIFGLHQVIELLCKHGISKVLQRLGLHYVSNYVLKRFPCVYKFPLKAVVSHNPVQKVPEYKRTDRKWCTNQE